jgi:hypothetical protein
MNCRWPSQQGQPLALTLPHLLARHRRPVPELHQLTRHLEVRHLEAWHQPPHWQRRKPQAFQHHPRVPRARPPLMMAARRAMPQAALQRFVVECRRRAADERGPPPSRASRERLA